MKHYLPHPLAAGWLFATLCVAPAHQPLAAASDEPSILQADHEFLRAIAKDDKAALAKLLDDEFTWTDATGKTQTRSDVLKALPKPALSADSGATVKQLTYGQVGAVMADHEKLHILHIWVKRSTGWRVPPLTRSNISVAIDTCQPALRSPTRFSFGTRTLS